jgi:hypothetical protein
MIWIATLGVMSLVYPFAGARGGFFHSGSAVQTVLWAAAPVGFVHIIEWAARVRKWDVPRALRLFVPPVSLIVVLLTGVSTYRLVIGADFAKPVWNSSQQAYRRVEEAVCKLDPSQKVAVLVNNPAGYALVSPRPAYAIPNGDVNTLLAVARRYQVPYVLIDQNIPQGLAPVHEHPQANSGLIYVGAVDQTMIFQVAAP